MSNIFPSISFAILTLAKSSNVILSDEQVKLVVESTTKFLGFDVMCSVENYFSEELTPSQVESFVWGCLPFTSDIMTTASIVLDYAWSEIESL